jgi:hypothetical protein
MLVNLTPVRVGAFNLPLYLRTPPPGSPGQPLPPVMADLGPAVAFISPIAVSATGICVGPRVRLERVLLDWGNTLVLSDSTRSVFLINDSPIPANFNAFFHKRSSMFKVVPEVGIVPALSRLKLQIAACLNETLPVKDVLHIHIADGDDISLTLKASGVGTTIALSPSDNYKPDIWTGQRGLEVINHGIVFTQQPISKTFCLENRGRRPHSIIWDLVPPAEAAVLDSAKQRLKQLELQRLSANSRKVSQTQLYEEKDATPDSDSKLLLNDESFRPVQLQSGPFLGTADEKDRELEKDVAQILLRRKLRSREVTDSSSNCFDITPRKVVLQPNQSVEFTVVGLGTLPFSVVESWICRASIGDEKSLSTLYETKIMAQFCRPELRFSHPNLSFSYFSDPHQNDKKPWVEPG